MHGVSRRKKHLLAKTIRRVTLPYPPHHPGFFTLTQSGYASIKSIYKTERSSVSFFPHATKVKQAFKNLFRYFQCARQMQNESGANSPLAFHIDHPAQTLHAIFNKIKSEAGAF